MIDSLHNADDSLESSQPGNLRSNGVRLRSEARRGAVPASQTSPLPPLRVLVIRSVSGSGGGAEKIILRTKSSCDAFGLHLTVCAIHSETDHEFDFVIRASRVGLETIAVPQRWPGDPAVYRRLADLAGSQQFDIVHSHDYKANFYALKIGRRFGLPTVSTAHGWTGHLWRERAFYYPLDKRLLRKFDAVIGVSSDISNELVQRGVEPERVTTILNGVDPAKYVTDPATRCSVRSELGFNDRHIVLGSVGRAEKQKRFDLLIEAFAELAPRRPELRLVIAGAGSLLENLQDLAGRRGVSERCQLLGHRSDMLRLYHAFDVYVQSSEYEGTPTVLLEAMAMRIPIVATDVGGTTELAAPFRHALVVPPHNVNALAQAVAQVIDEQAAAQERVNLARARIESELSIAYRTKRLSEVYAAAIAVRRRR